MKKLSTLENASSQSLSTGMASSLDVLLSDSGNSPSAVSETFLMLISLKNLHLAVHFSLVT